MDDEIYDAILRAYVQGLTNLSNEVSDSLSAEVIADCLISGGVEVLRKAEGAAVAAHRLRLAAEVVIEQNVVH